MRVRPPLDSGRRRIARSPRRAGPTHTAPGSRAQARLIIAYSFAYSRLFMLPMYNRELTVYNSLMASGDSNEKLDKARLNSALIGIAVDVIANRGTRDDLRKELHKIFKEGAVSDSLLDALMKKAKETMRSRLKASDDDHRAIALAFYESVISTRRLSVRDRMSAQQAIVDLLGLRIEPTKGQTPEESARMAREFLAASANVTEAPTPSEIDATQENET